MTTTARGTFSVTMQPQSPQQPVDGTTLGRMTLDKRFEGDLQGIGQGEMLTAMTATEGSAGYVAIERVSGSLHGRPGSFVLQHTGTLARGAQQSSISVVPDSGSGELAGLSGRLAIDIEGGKHSYAFEYTLLDQPLPE